MIFRHFKKIIGFVKRDKKSPTVGKIEESIHFINNKAKEIVSESKVIMEKLHDLQSTNYQLGLVQLEKGNLKEAIFRFKIVRKFWPTNYDAHLKLIYCYYADNHENHANRAIERLLELDPNSKAQIDQVKIDASFYNKSPIPDQTQSQATSSNLIRDNVSDSNEVLNL